MTDTTYTTRFLAYARARGLSPETVMVLEADEERWRGYRMAGFLCWITDRWRAYDEEHGIPRNTPRTGEMHADFDRWLEVGP